MRSRNARVGARLVVALSAVALTQGCANLQNIRVAPLPTQNSSSYRSMLSQFNPNPFQHLDLTQGALLRSPEDRSGGVFHFYY